MSYEEPPIDNNNTLGDHESRSRVKRKRFVESPKEFRMIHEEILSTIESDDKGINKQRLYDFADKEGLPRREILFLSEDGIKKINSIFKKWGVSLIGSFDSNIMEHGGFILGLNIVIVRRDREAETRFGTVRTEGLTAHELGHGSSTLDYFVQTEAEGESMPRIPRSGFTLQDDKIGQFFEEGFAELYRARYLREYTSSAEKSERLKRMSRILQKTNPGELTLSSMISLNVRGDKVRLPLAYIDIADDDEVQVPIASPAAAALELLFEEDPSLPETMKQARSDITALRKMVSKIDAISPGLYVVLRKLQYNQQDFYGGLHLIEDIANKRVKPGQSE